MLMIPRMRTPVVVALHGHAFAGGCGIVAAADVAIAAEGTLFATSEITIGLFPIIVYPTLAKAIGARAAREMALTGRRLDAAEALPSASCTASSTGPAPRRGAATAAELAAFGSPRARPRQVVHAPGRRPPGRARPRRSPRRAAGRS